MPPPTAPEGAAVDVANAPSTADPTREPIATSESAAPIAAPLFVERGAPSRTAGNRRSGRPWVIGLLIVAFVIVAGMFVFKRQLEQMFPGASAVYQSMGLRSSDSAGG